MTSSLTLIGRRCAKEFLGNAVVLRLIVAFKDEMLGGKSYALCARHDYAEPLRFLLKRLITGLPPHQIDAQNPFLGAVGPHEALAIALEGLAGYYLTWEDRPLFRMKNLLAFQKDAQTLMIDQLWAALLVSAQKEGKIKRVRVGMCGSEIMPHLPTEFLQELFDRGLVDLHQHYHASSLPSMIWTEAVGRPDQLMRATYSFDDDREFFPEGWARLDLYAHLRNARWIRRFLCHWLDKSPLAGGEILWQFARSVRFRYRKQALLPSLQPLSNVPKYQNERYFVTHALLALEHLDMSDPEDFLIYFCVHYYLLVQNIFMQNYVQQDQHFGFESFSRFERGTGLQAYKLRSFAQAARSYQRDHYLKAVEPRLVPPEKLTDYARLNRLFLGKGLPPQLDWGLVFHLIKKKDRPVQGPQPVCRHHVLRHEVYRALRGLLASREVYGKLAEHYLALDAANDERFAGPEVYAAAFRWFRQRFREPTRSNPGKEFRLPGITFHAGESFEHPLSGIRYVDEALDFLEMGTGDRIGHGLALGINLRQWHRVMGDEVVIANRGQWLDNLLWMLDQGEASRFPAALVKKVTSMCKALALECYCENLVDGAADLRTPHLLRLAHKFRRAEPSRALRRYEGSMNEELEVLEAEHGWAARELWDHYHFCLACREAYSQPIILTPEILPPTNQWLKALSQCQEVVLERMFGRGISIEVNPTSNLRISHFDQMKHHPIFSWFPTKPSARKARPKVTINADNYCVFQTTLPLEYAYLAMAARETRMSYKHIEKWLETIRQNGFTCSFLPIEPSG